MTGTGKTAEIEFEKIYKLSVDEIPAARPTLRKDLSDLVYKDQFLKWNAISKICNKISSTGQPILIGTITIATNMAGRGTDIILGGNITFNVQKELYDIL